MSLASLIGIRPRVPRTPGSGRRRLHRPPERFNVVGVFAAGPSKTIVLAEQQPQVRETKWNLGTHHDRVLSFPRLLFAIEFGCGVWENVSGFFLKGPYAGLQTHLHHTVLPNANGSGWICMGNAETKDALMRKTAGLPDWKSKAEAVLSNFWSTNFNDHVIGRLTEVGPTLDPNLASLATWEAASRRDPDFVNRVPWLMAGTAGGFLHSKGVAL